MRRPPLTFFVPALVFATVCLTAVAWQCRVAYASYLASAQEADRLTRVTALTPQDATVWHKLGIALLKRDSPRAGVSLRQAVALNPRDAEAWAALGLFTEMQGELPEAEAFYRKGASLTKRYRPKLALALYYFRTQSSENFWHAAAEAASVQGAYLGRVFELAHAMADDPETVPERLRLSSEYSLASYLSFLIETRRPGAVGDVSRRLPATEQHRDRLFSATERLIQEGDVSSAVALWNRLSAGGFTGTEPLDTVRGPFITNPGLLELPSRGFNWRSASLPGASLVFRSGGGLLLEFTGEQPEIGNVLTQCLAVEAGRDYLLRIRYETNNIHQPTGLRWIVNEPLSREDLSSGSAVLKPIAEGVAEARFRAPTQTRLLCLTLTYGRVPGSMRINGDVTLREVQIERVP